MSRRIGTLLTVFLVWTGFGLSGTAQIVTSGLILNLEAGNNPLGSSENPAEWADVSGGAVFPGAGSSPARWTASPGDPRRLLDVDTNAYYTVTDTGGAQFGLSATNGLSSSEPALDVEDFTIEVWLRRQGESFGDQHQICGLRAEFNEQRFAVGLATPGDAPIPLNNIIVSEFAAVGFFGVLPFDTGINLPADGDFHHLVFSYDNMGGAPNVPTLSCYSDNAATDLTAAVQANLRDLDSAGGPDPVDWIQFQHPWSTIFTAFNLEFGRRFNGDVAAYRIYDRALNPGEVGQNFNEGLPPIVDPTTNAPDVVDETLTSASHTLEGVNLGVGNITQGISPTVAAGSVIAQDPVDGTLVFEGTKVDLVESVGMGNQVPYVLGDVLVSASNDIVAAGLTVGSVTIDYNNDHPIDTVGVVNPDVGTFLFPGTAVDIVISSGRFGFDTLTLGESTVITFDTVNGASYSLLSGPDSNSLSFANIEVVGDGGQMTLFDTAAPGGVDTNTTAYGIIEVQP